MRKVLVSNRTVVYGEGGTGIPLISLHGGTDYLATRYRVIAYDRYGYDNSTGYTVANEVISLKSKL